MPVEQRSGGSQVASILVGVAVVVVAVASTWGLLHLASGDDAPVRVQLGDETFDAGNAERAAARIAADGPELYPDVSGRGQRRPIWVNHFGEDASRGWYVFSAVPPSGGENCFVTWNEAENLFDVRQPDPDDPRALGELCNDDQYPVTGDGLEQFRWQVDGDGRLVVTLRDQEDDAPSSEDPGIDADTVDPGDDG